MILITGAAGKTGRAILKELVNRKEEVRVFVRKQEQAQALTQLGAKETMIGDLLDTASIQDAVDGISAIYHICPNVHPQEVEIGQTIIDAAKTAGVEHFTYHSVLYPQIEAMPHHWLKMRVEELLIQSALPFTILQPTAYMQNVQAYWQQITQEGIYAVPYPSDVQMSLVDLNDVAEAAANVLTSKSHYYSIYLLAASDPLTSADIASALSQHLNQDVKAGQINLNDWRSMVETNGLGSYQVETLLKMFRYYENNGFVANSNHLGFLLGREPNTFQEFLQTVPNK
ncbi:MAG: NAD-dependent epimerase/dehydratase family protein [Chloroflexi bacterium]|nr:MAG: NAD-dependent epimerase/dehydratase family protein [Chloroflexota bacterium]MBL1196102.1 NAD-dependent epimerase/dehydratase family protein [Chloroflexota bacterium]NOH13395.1 NmrA family NAD(P)-binding protein [Chloroflexota bacterium]